MAIGIVKFVAGAKTNHNLPTYNIVTSGKGFATLTRITGSAIGGHKLIQDAGATFVKGLKTIVVPGYNRGT